MEEFRAVRDTILKGAVRGESDLAVLGGNRLIWSRIFYFLKLHYYQYHVDKTSIPYLLPQDLRILPLRFPEPTGLSINMMPILLTSLGTSLPHFAQPYRRIIARCPMHFHSELEAPPRWFGSPPPQEVGYLTVEEGWVPVGQSQRRPGVHIERPGSMNGARVVENRKFSTGMGWGGGSCLPGKIPVGGIFMASSVANSCKVWPLQISKPEQVTDGHGGLEHMRECLGEGHSLGANEMVWFTDTTPHESVPLVSASPGEKYVYRQFFRLIVGRISVWYSKHNTPNPLGVQPDALISHEDKFS